jgi:hypothetical protein
MSAPILVEQIFHVLEKLHVSTLVRGDGDSVNILLNGAFNDLGHRPVMAQMDDLRTLALQDPAHDIDRRIVAIEQAGCCYDPDLIFRGIRHKLTIVSAKLQKVPA